MSTNIYKTAQKSNSVWNFSILQALNDPKNLQQVTPNRPCHIPNFGAQIPTNAIKRAFFASFSHHLDSESLDTVSTAMFTALKVTIPHQSHTVAIQLNNTVDHMTAALHLSQYHMTNPETVRFHQHHTLAAPNDKGVHAPSVHGERDLHALAYQADGFGKNLFVGRHISLHPRCHKNQNELYGSRRLFEAPG